MWRVLAVPTVLIGTGIGGTGCYHYVMTEDLPPDGSRVEVVMTTEARRTLQEGGVVFLEFADMDLGTLDGIMVTHTSDSLVVDLASARVRGFRGGTLRQRVALATSDVVQIRRRTFNVTQSALIGGGIGLIVTAIILTTLGGT